MNDIFDLGTPGPAGNENDTYYTFYGFTGFDGRTIMPILQQRLVKDAVLATPVEIDTYMSAIGFTILNNEGRYANTDYEVWDLVPRSVLKDNDGDIYVIDAEIRKIVPHKVSITL